MDTTCSIRTSTIQKYTAPKSISCLSNNTHTQVNVLRRRRFMQGKAVRGENVLNGEPLHSFLFSAVLPVCNEGSVLFVFFLLISKKENRSSGFTHQGSYLSFKIVKREIIDTNCQLKQTGYSNHNQPTSGSLFSVEYLDSIAGIFTPSRLYLYSKTLEHGQLKVCWSLLLFGSVQCTGY